MTKLLSIIVLILSIILFPPASLALISNNAVPGDATYPIKRTLEDGIYAIASLNPITRAWFSAARSDRRFKEFSTLIAQGKSASDTLDELVSQTDIAANELARVEDPVRKGQLADQLLDSIKKYEQGLEEASNQIIGKELASNQPQPTPIPVAEPASPPLVQSTSQPTSAATAAPVQPKSSPTPVSTPVSTPRPTPSIQPATPPQPPQGGADAKDIEEARKKIEETKKKIEEERKKLKEEREEKRESRQDKRQESEEREHRENKKEDFKTDKKSDN